MNRFYCESCGGSAFSAVLSHQVHHYKASDTPTTWSYDLLQCKDCGMGFINPKPTLEILQTFYGSDYGNYAVTMDHAKEAQSLKYSLAKSRYASIYSRSLRGQVYSVVGSIVEWLTGKVVPYPLGIPINLPKNVRILDVGYGSGSWLLTMAQLGYTNLTGFDIDANGANRKRLEDFGIKVFTGSLLDTTYPDECFDCIRLEHVFEHLLEPDRILAELHRILKPGGLLLMSFPSINCMSFSISPLHSAVRDSPRHLYLHTPQSARNIISRSGFIIQDMRIYGVVLQLESCLNNILKNNNIPIKLRGFSLLSPIYHFINVIFRRGEFITVYATK